MAETWKTDDVCVRHCPGLASRRYIMQARHVVDHWLSLNFHNTAAQSSHLTRRSFPARYWHHMTCHVAVASFARWRATGRLWPDAEVLRDGPLSGRRGEATDSLQPSTEPK